jgi:hypothetical protein
MDRSRTVRHLSGAVYHLAYLPRPAAGRIDEESCGMRKPQAGIPGPVSPAFSISNFWLLASSYQLAFNIGACFRALHREATIRQLWPLPSASPVCPARPPDAVL